MKQSASVVPKRPSKFTRNFRAKTRWHPPLSHPARQIRLLYMFSGLEGDDLEFELTAWDLETAPDYVAISYTWGENRDHKTVYINGRPREVWPNCHYALWQVRLHHPGSYIWLDSICIEQDNLGEKSHQVAMMGDIYKRAAFTCACIGPAAEDGHDLLADFISQLGQVKLEYEDIRKHPGFDSSFGEESDGSVDVQDPTEPIEQFCQQWILRHRQQDIVALAGEMFAFLSRPYWQRVWIMQEITLSKSVSILFGREVRSWQAVRRLPWLHHYTIPVEHSPDIERFSRLVWLVFDKVVPLEDFARTINGFQCYDPRDKIYGLLSMYQFEEEEHTITPDYTRTTLQLACSMATHVYWGQLGRMLQLLEVTMNDPGMTALVQQRQQAPALILKNPSKRRSFRPEKLQCLKVGSDRKGRLTCSLWQDSRVMNPTHLALQDQMLNKLRRLNTDHAAARTCQGDSDPRAIYHKNKIVAVGCSELQEGDFITANEYVLANHFLVLRPVNEDKFKILGQGFMMPGVEACRYDDQSPYADIKDLSACTCGIEHNVLRTWVEVDLSDEDAVVLAGQDLLSGQMLEYDVDARFSRLATRVSERDNPMVYIVPFDPLELVLAERGLR
ncbi:uncharacterized protein RCC_05980 [Ramularia collo-cygni]|uniref:Heterokaryon incompatibility domain-containing protein n=1 Tax=Ramularia collo-cygni TaxID=112498 RepID=A0A2D3VHA9_9PEZI|nr:uncharacterized protein RCC_05980 [Ramularia collo-cygni]CZT20123.1 uncharacterized protein RCC_05980 [Ramularia collo-cygni]